MYGLYVIIHGKPPALITKGKADTLTTRALSLTSGIMSNQELLFRFSYPDAHGLLVRHLDTDELVFSVIL